MKTIHKYTITVIGSAVQIAMPDEAEIISFQAQSNQLCFWAIIDDSDDLTERHFMVIGTGQPITDDSYYIGTTQQPPYVWHLFELYR